MSLMLEIVIYQHDFPAGVARATASGSSAFIGETDESTVLDTLEYLGSSPPRWKPGNLDSISKGKC